MGNQRAERQAQVIHAHAQRTGLNNDQLSAALLQYATEHLAAWAEEEEAVDPGSVWCVGDLPWWLEDYLPQRSKELTF